MRFHKAGSLVASTFAAISLSSMPASAASVVADEYRGHALAVFGIVLVLTGAITYLASKRTKSVSSFYAAENSIGGVKNGFAIAGDFLSAAAFLGIGGLFTLFGFDAFTYTVGFVVAFVTVLLIVAEPCRNIGRYTLGDILAYRHNPKIAKTLAAIATITIAIFYLIPQLVGGGLLIELLIGVSYEVAILVVGVLMLVYVTVGGMLATTWIQVVKAVLLVSATCVIIFLALAPFGFDLLGFVSAVVGDSKVQARMAQVVGAASSSMTSKELGESILLPGWLIKNPWERLSLAMGLLFGTAALPHVLMRFFTVPDSKAARTSVIWAMGLIGFCNICFIFTGMAAAYYVGAARIASVDTGGNLAIPLLAQYLGGGAATLSGNLLLAFVSAVACATIVAVVAGAVLSAASAMAHDLYVGVLRGAKATEREQVIAARTASLIIGGIAIVLGILSKGQNVAHLTGLAFAIAASANFAAIVLTLYWSKLSTTGVVSGMVVGLVVAVGCVLVSPNMTYPSQVRTQASKVVGTAPKRIADLEATLAAAAVEQRPTILLQIQEQRRGLAAAQGNLRKYEGQETSVVGLREPLISLRNPGIIAIPLAFLAAILGSLLFRDPRAEFIYEEVRVRRTIGMTGATETSATHG